MIGRIRGQLIEKKPPQLLVDVHGVGYQLLAPLSTFVQLPELNQEVVLFTEFVVREDAQLLYGFMHEHDRTLFQKIIKISGVGPKLALGILSGMEPSQFAATIQEGDIQALVKLPGVGKKTAERLVVELRDKLSLSRGNSSFSQTAIMRQPEHKEEAVAALEALGYKPREAEKAIAKVYHEDKNTEELIRLALQGISS